MLDDTLDDMKIYLQDEGLEDQQIQEFFESHDFQSLNEDEGWEVIEAHIFRDTDLSAFPE